MYVYTIILLAEWAYFCLVVGSLLCIIHHVSRMARQLEEQTNQGTAENPLMIKVKHYSVGPINPEHTTTDGVVDEEEDYR